MHTLQLMIIHSATATEILGCKQMQLS